MSGLDSIAGGAVRTPADDHTRLRRVAAQMEGLFVEQLFKAMRETVPQDGLLDGGAGEEMFTGLMDQHLAGLVPERWDSGLGAAIYRQLAGRLQQLEPPAASPEVGGTT